MNFNSEIRVDDFIFRLRPLTYKEITKIQQESLQLQRILTQKILKMEDSEAKQAEMNALYDRMNDVSKNAICSSVVEITTPDGEKEMHHQFIVDFLANGEKEYFEETRKVYESNLENWTLKPSDVACSACNTSYKILPSLDYSSFFGQG
jgi:hypothetical protein